MKKKEGIEWRHVNFSYQKILAIVVTKEDIIDQKESWCGQPDGLMLIRPSCV
jgi:hypothetical protein